MKSEDMSITEMYPFHPLHPLVDMIPTHGQKIEKLQSDAQPHFFSTNAVAQQLTREELYINETQIDRKLRLYQVCARRGLRGTPLSLQRHQLQQVIVDEKNKLLYCWVPKVGPVNS